MSSVQGEKEKRKTLAAFISQKHFHSCSYVARAWRFSVYLFFSELVTFSDCSCIEYFAYLFLARAAQRILEGPPECAHRFQHLDVDNYHDRYICWLRPHFHSEMCEFSTKRMRLMVQIFDALNGIWLLKYVEWNHVISQLKFDCFSTVI